MNFSGGYVIHSTPLVRHSGCVKTHTASVDRPLSATALAALNIVQATGWRINEPIRQVMAQAFATGQPLPGLDVGEAIPAPPRVDDDVWEVMSAEDKAKHIAERRSIHDARASRDGRYRALLDQLDVAYDLRNKAALWFPHTVDFRSRIYPLGVAGPHPQSNDVGKALLEFAEAKPLGAAGEGQLLARAAHYYGHDKDPFDVQVQWAIVNMADIIACAQRPLEVSAWQKADKPWQFLATCFELAEAYRTDAPSTIDGFMSRLPVSVDGSCNGLQHLSAMGLDTIGARAVNMTDDAVRHDIYGEIAAIVAKAVERDAAANVEAALHWHGRVTRAVAKRAVMTTPYGVTSGGIAEQLLSDGAKKDWFDGLTTKQATVAAAYLRDRLVDALGERIGSARTIMAWLQTTAHRLAQAQIPFEWTTPSGCRIRQAYALLAERRVSTVCGRMRLTEDNPKSGLDAGKQARGAAPNYVHSFDAAHLSLTVCAAYKAGIDAFALVHDSYGTRACDVAKLGVILRDQFVRIYETDWLADLHTELRVSYPHVELPEPPKRGEFDVGQVRRARYFFS